MKIINLTKKDLLNGFVAGSKNSQFTQSWEWGEFQESAGHKVLRLGAEEDGELVAVATLIKKKLGMGKNYFYCPRGPVAQVESDKLKVESYKFLFENIKDSTRQEKIIFLRFEPDFRLQTSDFRLQRTLDVQPSKTSILDLSKTEEDLLKAMHQKTRYNIKLAEKKGVIIREGSTEDFEAFWMLMSETKERDGFRVHNKEYYRKMFAIRNSQSGIRNQEEIRADYPNSQFQIPNPCLTINLFLAEYEGRVIAGNIMSFFGDSVTYMHGASSNQYRNVMAPFAMQWHCIRLARALGYRYYDFYGVDESKWPGVTRFKRGFGGTEIRISRYFRFCF